MQESTLSHLPFSDKIRSLLLKKKQNGRLFQVHSVLFELPGERWFCTAVLDGTSAAVNKNRDVEPPQVAHRQTEDSPLPAHAQWKWSWPHFLSFQTNPSSLKCVAFSQIYLVVVQQLSGTNTSHCPKQRVRIYTLIENATFVFRTRNRLKATDISMNSSYFCRVCVCWVELELKTCSSLSALESPLSTLSKTLTHQTMVDCLQSSHLTLEECPAWIRPSVHVLTLHWVCKVTTAATPKTRSRRHRTLLTDRSSLTWGSNYVSIQRCKIYLCTKPHKILN